MPTLFSCLLSRFTLWMSLGKGWSRKRCSESGREPPKTYILTAAHPLFTAVAPYACISSVITLSPVSLILLLTHGLNTKPCRLRASRDTGTDRSTPETDVVSMDHMDKATKASTLFGVILNFPPKNSITGWGAVGHV